MAAAKFLQLQSTLDVSFWSELGDRKLNEYKLSDAPISVVGWIGPSRYAQVPGQLLVDSSSFPPSASTSESPSAHRAGLHSVPGQLTIFNTMEQLQKSCDKAQLLRKAAASIWQHIRSGAAEKDPSLLMSFSLITYADLKNFKFTYWFVFPALKPPQPFTCSQAGSLATELGAELAEQVCAACDAWREPPQKPQTSQSTHTGAGAPGSGQPVWLVRVVTDATSQKRVVTARLCDWGSLQQGSGDQVYLAVSDTSNMEGVAGWPLRNVLLMAAVRWRCKQVKVVCCRELKGRTDPNRSQLITTGLPDIPEHWSETDTDSCPDAVGWEPNSEGRLLPREVNLSALMSPHHLAEQAVDLNLHLMKWRAAPELDTGKVAQTKCLLLGAGTLGCAVARTLLGWGVRHITFVDSSRVAYSNPVRQSLYEFNDCLDGGKPKAEAAAAAVQRIFPSAQATGIALSIPMPGHPPSTPTQESEARANTERLDQLVREHDAVFLLTDTRESRWLPTLLAAAHNKVAITSAVGFDSFLVMRHGAGPQAGGADPYPGYKRLGCYFCNDVVAPVNSTRDRALDQQCTVARPGLAPLASALAVELLVSLFQHPAHTHAPPPSTTTTTAATTSTSTPANTPAVSGVLGPVPHMVRGQLSGFQQTCMEGHAFGLCTACSPTVVDGYRKDGWQFVLQALTVPQYLEDLTGLTHLHKLTLDLIASDDDEKSEKSDCSGAAAAAAAAAAGGDGTTGTAGQGMGGSAEDEGGEKDDWLEL